MKLAQWENAVAVASNHEQLGQFEAAVALYGKAAAIDDGFAELHFRLAGCYVHLGRFDEARKHFALARDLDTLRFRADSRINELIRGTASARVGEGVVLVDTARAFEDERVSPHGIPGRTLFLEHVHMTFAGNYALARSLFEGVQGLLPDVTLLLDIPVAAGFERLQIRNAGAQIQKDRIERETLTFHERVRDGYLDLARRWPDRIRRIDTAGVFAEVHEELWRVVKRVIDR